MSVEELSALPLDVLKKNKTTTFLVLNILLAFNLGLFYKSLSLGSSILLFVCIGLAIATSAIYDNYKLYVKLINNK